MLVAGFRRREGVLNLFVNTLEREAKIDRVLIEVGSEVVGGKPEQSFWQSHRLRKAGPEIGRNCGFSATKPISRTQSA